MPVDKKLVPVKGHFFLFNAGTAALVPYMSTYARQLGFNSSTVGLIYTILPLSGLFAKPFFGAIADKYRALKTIFIMFQVVTILSFCAIYYIPHTEENRIPVQLDCRNSSSILRACPYNRSAGSKCEAKDIISKMQSATCKMTCNKTTLSLGKPNCEHWFVPTLCSKDTYIKGYNAVVTDARITNDCFIISTQTMDLGNGNLYETGCETGNIFETGNFFEPCELQCSDPNLADLTHESGMNTTCIENKLSYQVCNDESMANVIHSLKTKDQLGKCKVYCNISTSIKQTEICDVWNTGGENVCRIRDDDSFPEIIHLEATVALPELGSSGDCALYEIGYIKIKDGPRYFPYCSPNNKGGHEPESYQPQCFVHCDNEMVNDILKSTLEHSGNKPQYNFQFWMFLVLMTVNWIGQAVVVTFADAICFNILGLRISHYGNQRLWGSFGWGTVSLLTGILIDAFSQGAYKNYTIAFILMFIFMSGDVISSGFIKVETSQISVNILADVGSILSSYGNVLFLIWTVAVGLCTGMIWQFLFWLIEDIAKLTCNEIQHVKTVQGLVSAIQTFGGEIPFMLLSGEILKRFGHNHVMSAVLFGFGIRFILYSHLTKAWWILPIELFQGVTSGMFYPTMTSYADIVAPAGAKTTVQGLVGAIFEGIGCSLGSYIGGRLYGDLGGPMAFRYFGYGALGAGVLHAIAVMFVKKETRQGLTLEMSTIVRYNRRASDDGEMQILSDRGEVY